ncbi:MAG: hypothetical protein HY731_02055 [Candidatus Tectomicrobia bacterium]|nr:hypothetical protein [Candidatus Tectomicrobia bacterium]
MTIGFTESTVESAALDWLESLGWRGTHGIEIAPGEPGSERTEDGLVGFRAAIRRKIEN